jgi:hypothetical protein
MRMRSWVILATLSAAAAAVAFLSCGPVDDKNEDDDTVTIDIKVLRDDLFGLNEKQVIGQAKFSRHDGPVGVMVRSKIFINTLSRFPDQRIGMRLELENQDAVLEEWPAVEWTQESNLKYVDFAIPLVATIPVQLNFRVLAYYYGEEEQTAAYDTADDDASPADDDDDDNDNDDNNDVADDDATDDDAADDDAVDDDAGDDDTSPLPDQYFQAEGIYLFVVDKGMPVTGD